VSSTELNTELNTICTVRDSTIRLAIQLYNSAYDSALQFWLTKMGETIQASEQRLYRGPKRVSRVEAFAGGR